MHTPPHSISQPNPVRTFSGRAPYNFVVRNAGTVCCAEIGGRRSNLGILGAAYAHGSIVTDDLDLEIIRIEQVGYPATAGMDFLE